MPRKKAVSAEEQAIINLWGVTPDWHSDAVEWYEALRSIPREWTKAEVAHARMLSEDLSIYKKTIPRNAAMAKVLYTEMNAFLTTPKSYDEALANKTPEETTFAPDVDYIATFMTTMRTGPQSKKEVSK